MEDDPIIAEANAEALAYDDEGFYGQEFGFYASGNGESPSAWGGFFGPSGLGRTVSGRNAVREPNLTPITERSEYSTRNSFISLNHFRDGQQPMSSPGLAQLARMSPYGFPGPEEEGDMSLDALLKLRVDRPHRVDPQHQAASSHIKSRQISRATGLSEASASV